MIVWLVYEYKRRKDSKAEKENQSICVSVCKEKGDMEKVYAKVDQNSNSTPRGSKHEGVRHARICYA